MDDLFELFLKEKRYLANVTEKTLLFYKSSYSTLKRSLEGEISKQSLNQVVIKLRQSGIKTTSINCYARGINSFLSWLYENGYLKEKLRIKALPEEKKNKSIYTEVELKALLSWKPSNETEQRLYALLLTLIDTGVRINEALTLTKSKVDFDNLLITVYGKGSKERTIPISPELRKVLYKWCKKHSFELVFCNRDGNKLSANNLRRDMKILFKRLGISTDGSFHKFRHTFGYNFARTVAKITGDARNGIFHLQKQLGHSCLQTTRIYVDIQPEDLKELHLQTSILSRLKS
jgi:integrase/recombinase XerD